MLPNDDPSNPIVKALISLFEKQLRRFEDETFDPNKLSENFKLSEFTNQMPPQYRKEPTKEQRLNLMRLSTFVLEPLRAILGAKIQITSGFRTPEYNQSLAGQGARPAKDSDHLRGQAADIQAYKMNGERIDPLKVYKAIKDNLNYRQVILYKAGAAGYPNGGVHVSYVKDDNKKQFLQVDPPYTYSVGP